MSKVIMYKWSAGGVHNYACVKIIKSRNSDDEDKVQRDSHVGEVDRMKLGRESREAGDEIWRKEEGKDREKGTAASQMEIGVM